MALLLLFSLGWGQLLMEKQPKQRGWQVVQSWGGTLPTQWLTSPAWRGGSRPKPQNSDGGLAES